MAFLFRNMVKKLHRGHFFIHLGTFPFSFSVSPSLLNTSVRKRSGYFLSFHFIPSISSFWHIYERSRRNSRIIAYLDKYNQFFHYNNSSAGKNRIKDISLLYTENDSTYLCFCRHDPSQQKCFMIRLWHKMEFGKLYYVSYAANIKWQH